MHKDCFIGDFREGAKNQIRFKRNDQGELDENGEIRDEKLELQVKYSKQTRLSLGVAMKGEGDDEEGVRLEPFDYTSQTIVTIGTMNKMIRTEIRRVKALSRTHKDWVSHERDANALYKDDPVIKVKGVGATAEKLLLENEIILVSDLLKLKGDDDAIKKVLKTKGLGKASLKKFIEDCDARVVEGDAPEVDYYLDSPNPYAAKYGEELDEWGEEKWRTQIKKASAFAGKVCITALVKHIVVHTKACYADTEHKDTWYFYHDALSQLTNEACVDWMIKTKVPGEEKSIYDRWIKPEKGLNDDYGKKWRRRPIGNSSELMVRHLFVVCLCLLLCLFV